MALGRRKRERQTELWIASGDLSRSGGHPFYQKLNGLLDEAGFDDFVEELCRPFYADDLGRPGIPPGVYFRMLFICYFEGLDSQRGIAWRCADSLALEQFLGYGLTDATPEHSSLTNTRKRLPQAVHKHVFAFVLSLAAAKKLLKGKTVGVDATLLEASAAMKSIVCKQTGEDYKAYLRRLAQEAGIDDASDDDLKKFDQKRKKKGSNKEWQSPSDPDARIMKMKDGRTHLSYKAEHALDMQSGLLLAATIHHGDTSDGDSLQETLITAQTNLIRAGSELRSKTLPWTTAITPTRPWRNVRPGEFAPTRRRRTSAISAGGVTNRTTTSAPFMPIGGAFADVAGRSCSVFAASIASAALRTRARRALRRAACRAGRRRCARRWRGWWTSSPRT